MSNWQDFFIHFKNFVTEWKEFLIWFGGLAGIYSFLKHIKNDISRPILEMKFNPDNDIKFWSVGPPFIMGIERMKVANIRVRNKRKKPAIGCEAFVKIWDQCGHFIAEPPLHWADTSYSPLSTSMEPVTISKIPRRLYVAFTQEIQAIKEGCSIASAQALASGVQNDQFYLPKGEYKIRICVSYNSGKITKKNFVLISPDSWENLNMKFA